MATESVVPAELEMNIENEESILQEKPGEESMEIQESELLEMEEKLIQEEEEEEDIAEPMEEVSVSNSGVTSGEDTQEQISEELPEIFDQSSEVVETSLEHSEAPESQDKPFLNDEEKENQEVSDNLVAENAIDEPLPEEKQNGDDPSAVCASVNGENKSLPEAPSSDSNCYCGRSRNLNSVELQCAGCYKWFHETCINIPIGKCLPFMTYYTFFCRTCNPSGTETFSKKQPNFSQMCSTALANLTQHSLLLGKPKTMFSKDKEIIPYIESNWELLTAMPRRVKQTWHSTVYRAMTKDNDFFLCEEKKTEVNHYPPSFGLANQDLSKIGPSYESMTRGGLQKQIQDLSVPATGFKGRSAKRRFFGDGQIVAGGKKVKSDLVMPKLPSNGYPMEHPFNKDGYRYILAEPDPHAPFRQEFDESQDWAGKPIPGWLYRKLTPNNVLLALHDRAPQLRVSEDRLTVTGEKGYCMIRATHGVSRGTWYYEINLDEMSDGSATRLGWSQGLANLQAPLGYDKFSYSWRSRKGTKFHESRGKHFAEEGYGHGDTVGFLIHMPNLEELTPLPPIFKDKPLVKFKSYLYYEEKDEPQLELKRLSPLKGSKISCFKNGKFIGDAFVDIYDGIYFPAASLYKNCSISFNFGPDFKFPPNNMSFQGMYEAAHEAIVEQTMTDLLFFTENKGKLRLDIY